MVYAAFMPPRSVYPWQIKFGAGVATYIVAASNSTNKKKADYVCDGKADEVEINQAISALPSTGGLIWLLEGYYTISSSIIINKDNVMIVGGGHSTVIRPAIGVPDNTYMLYADIIDDTIIANLKLDGRKDVQAGNIYGIRFNGVARGRILNCYIKDMKNHGIWLYNSPDLFISGNIVETCDGYGIYLRTDTDRCFVIGNRVYETGEVGIILDSCDNCMIDNNYEEKSGQSGASGYGIYVYSSNNISITSNKLINDNNYGIVLNISTNCSITSNYVYSTGNGIFLSESTENTIGNNVLDNNGGHQLLLMSSNNNTISGNLVNDGDASGLVIYQSHRNTVTGNISQTNKEYGIYVLQSDDNNVTGNICHDNDVDNTTTYDGIRIYDGDNNIVSSNRCKDNDRYEISIAGVSNKTLVGINTVIGTDHVDTIFDSGTDSQIFNNIEA